MKIANLYLRSGYFTFKFMTFWKGQFFFKMEGVYFVVFTHLIVLILTFKYLLLYGERW